MGHDAGLSRDAGPGDDTGTQGLPEEQAVAAAAGAMLPPHLDANAMTTAAGREPEAETETDDDEDEDEEQNR